MIAAFQKKSRWVTYTGRAEKPGTPPNKKRYHVGQLHIYDDAVSAHASVSTSSNGKSEAKIAKYTAQVDDMTGGKRGKKDEKDVNPEGTHWGNLFEEAVVFTCWAVIEAEHQLRYKPLSLIEEVAENAGG